jgi:hypothetical protein
VVRQRAGEMSVSVTLTMRGKESGFISKSFHGFGPDGICDPAKDRLAVLWPTIEAAGGGYIFDSEVLLEVVVSGGGTQWAALAGAGLDARILRAPCPVGWSFSAQSRACIACFPSQYGVNPPSADHPFDHPPHPNPAASVT